MPERKYNAMIYVTLELPVVVEAKSFDAAELKLMQMDRCHALKEIREKGEPQYDSFEVYVAVEA